MASRRKLKKAIKFVMTEVVAEMYFLSFFKEVDETKLDELVMKAIDLNNQLILRVNHYDGKSDPKIVKTYFRKLREDWTNSVQEIAEEVGGL